MSGRTCPECHATRINVIESHLTFNNQAKRIRRRCIACKHSWTTYEVTQETLDKYKVLQQKIDFLRMHLFSEGNVFDCHNCTQWENDHCSLDIPEAGGSFASECSYYYKA